MPTLHNTVEETRFLARWVGVFVVGLICLIMLFRALFAIKEYFFPTPPPPPTVDFGKVPRIPFPQATTPVRYSYTITTASGNLPDFPDREFIYEIQQPQPDLLSLDNIKNLVATTEYQGVDPVQDNDTDYTWALPKSPYKRLTFDTYTNDFTILSQYSSDPDVLAAHSLPDQQGAIRTAQDFLQALNSYPDNIDDSKTIPTLMAIQNGNLVHATSLSNAQIIRVDFYQKDQDKLPVYYPYPPASTMNLLIGSGDQLPQIVEAHYNGKMLTGKKGEYPIKTAQEAYNDLVAGKAYIASFEVATANHPINTSFGAPTEIQITNVSLGYYMGDQKQKYMMPIVVFTDDYGFQAYVSAVKDTWIDTSMSQ